MRCIIFILIVFLSFGCSNYKKLSKSNNNDVEVGSLVIKDKCYKDLRGGAVVNFKVFDYDSNLAIATLAIVDDKFISVVDMEGELSIHLKNKDCFSLKIYDVGRLSFSNNELCFDSNTVTNGEIYLEYYTDYRSY
jgi:hypothetical protein